jgi:hypothetical protein
MSDVRHEPMSEQYLTTAEVARRLRLTTKTLRNKVAAGLFREGEHFFRKPGLGPRWCWERVVAWLEGDHQDKGEGEIVPLAEPGGRRTT